MMASETNDIEPVKAAPTSADRWAIVLSVLCMVHCLATPFLLALFPLFQVASNELYFHAVVLVPLVGFAFWAFWRGYRLHQKKISIVLGICGFLLLLLGLGLHEQLIHMNAATEAAHEHAHVSHGFRITWGSVATLIGSLFLIAAHIYNMKFCDCACHDDH